MNIKELEEMQSVSHIWTRHKQTIAARENSWQSYSYPAYPIRIDCTIRLPILFCWAKLNKRDNVGVNHLLWITHENIG